MRKSRSLARTLRFNGAGVLRPRKLPRWIRTLLRCSALQWGRGLKTPEMPQLKPMKPTCWGLQWGRGLKTPEIVLTADEPAWLCVLQWGRGLKTPEIVFPMVCAAILTRLQWGRGLKTPEIWPLPCHYNILLCFNGAGVLRPRKCRKPLASGIPISASMGPGS